MSLADVLQEVGRVAAVKRLLVESIRQLRQEIAAFKEEDPELPWVVRVPDRTPTVRGRGVATAAPDLAVLSFGVVGRDPSPSASVEELNGRVEDVPRSGAGTGAEGFVPDLLDASVLAPCE